MANEQMIYFLIGIIAILVLTWLVARMCGANDKQEMYMPDDIDYWQVWSVNYTGSRAKPLDIEIESDMMAKKNNAEYTSTEELLKNLK